MYGFSKWALDFPVFSCWVAEPNLSPTQWRHYSETFTRIYLILCISAWGFSVPFVFFVVFTDHVYSTVIIVVNKSSIDFLASFFWHHEKTCSYFRDTSSKKPKKFSRPFWTTLSHLGSQIRRCSTWWFICIRRLEVMTKLGDYCL